MAMHGHFQQCLTPHLAMHAAAVAAFCGGVHGVVMFVVVSMSIVTLLMLTVRLVLQWS